MKKFPDEKIKILKISQLQIIILTHSNRIFRWRDDLEEEFVEYEIPEKKEEGNIIQNTFVGVANLGKKMLFMNTNKRNISIE